MKNSRAVRAFWVSFALVKSTDMVFFLFCLYLTISKLKIQAHISTENIDRKGKTVNMLSFSKYLFFFQILLTTVC